MRHPRQLLLCTLLLNGLVPLAAQEDFLLRYNFLAGHLRLQLPENAAAYYGLDSSTNLPVFRSYSMSLGRRDPAWEIELDLWPEAAFFRAQRFSVYSPRDTDLDGMDDVWELERDLNPLDPADAGLDPEATD